jgi:hypothetical protein
VRETPPDPPGCHHDLLCAARAAEVRVRVRVTARAEPTVPEHSPSRHPLAACSCAVERFVAACAALKRISRHRTYAGPHMRHRPQAPAALRDYLRITRRERFLRPSRHLLSCVALHCARDRSSYQGDCLSQAASCTRCCQLDAGCLCQFLLRQPLKRGLRGTAGGGGIILCVTQAVFRVRNGRATSTATVTVDGAHVCTRARLCTSSLPLCCCFCHL